VQGSGTDGKAKVVGAHAGGESGVDGAGEAARGPNAAPGAYCQDQGNHGARRARVMGRAAATPGRARGEAFVTAVASDQSAV
jgi:hypothetical protein